MKFSKWNNPSKKRRAKKSPYSQKYIEEQRERMYQLLGEAKTDAERDAIIKAFHVSINP